MKTKTHSTEISRVRAIIKEKTEGKITPEHTIAGHFYRFPSGKLVSSVTTKLIVDKPHLVKWAAKMSAEWLLDGDRHLRITAENKEEYIRGAILSHTDKRDDAADVGTLAHETVERYLNAWMETNERPKDIKEFLPPGDLDYRVIGAARSAEASFDKYSIVPLASEIVVGSEKFNCAGSLDDIMFNTLTGSIELWDTKTSNQVSDSYAMQVAAYKKFFEEMTGLKVARCYIRKLDKFSNKFKVYQIPNLPSAFKSFKAISSVYDWQENGKAKLIEDKKIIKI